MLSFFESPNDNKAYMQGFVAGRKANGLDWGLAEAATLTERADKEKAWAEMIQIADAAQRVIQELKDTIRTMEAEHERQLDEKDSEIRAYKVAFRQLEREGLSGSRPRRI